MRATLLSPLQALLEQCASGNVTDEARTAAVHALAELRGLCLPMQVLVERLAAVEWAMVTAGQEPDASEHASLLARREVEAIGCDLSRVQARITGNLIGAFADRPPFV